MFRVCERKLDEGLEIARKIADIVAFLVGRQLHRQHALTFFTQGLNRIGQLNLASLIGTDTTDKIEDERRKNISACNGQVARASPAFGFSTRLSTRNEAPFRLDVHDAVLRRFLHRHFFHGENAARVFRLEDLHHAADRLRFRVQADNGVAESNHKGLFAREILPAQNRVSEPRCTRWRV